MSAMWQMVAARLTEVSSAGSAAFVTEWKTTGRSTDPAWPFTGLPREILAGRTPDKVYSQAG